MKIEKAIKILEDLYYKHTILLAGRDDEALRLGIEALQFFKGAQEVAGGYLELHLTGETKE